MSENLTFLPPWIDSLSMTVLNGKNSNQTLDFNRFRYIGAPSTKSILSGSAISANRESLIQHVFKSLTTHNIPEKKLLIIFETLRTHLVYCDQNRLYPLTQEGTSAYLQDIHERYCSEKISKRTSTQQRHNFKAVLLLLDLPARDWVPLISSSKIIRSEPKRQLLIAAINDNLSMLEHWDNRLSISLRNGNNAIQRMDFNRFRYAGTPSTRSILSGDVTLANRDVIVIRIFKTITEREEVASSTKMGAFRAMLNLLAFCDQHELTPLTKEGVIGYLNHLNARQRCGEIKDSAVVQQRAALSSVLQWLELPARDWLFSIASPRKTQSVSTKGYSDEDLKQLLPLLRGLFKQLYQQYIADPERHIQAPLTVSTMTFEWKGSQYAVYGGINKLFCSAIFLMSYYTWANASVLYQLKRPHTVSQKLSDEWHQMPAFKRRAFKTITVEIGAHGRLDIPKYALQFFDQLLNASRLLNPNPDGWLLPSVNFVGQVTMMSGAVINDFKLKWLSKYFPMTDARGERLWPVIRRFRATGGQLALAQKGVMNAALLLDNTPDVVKRAYSSGNPHENNLMNRDTSHTLEQAVRDRQGVAKAKEKVRETLKVNVLAYEAYIQYATPPARSANGSYCKDQNGSKAQRFSTHARQRGLLKEGERLACADLLGCWGCEHQVLVETLDDVWCILSFREHIIESSYLHLDNKHHQNNFGDILTNIDARLKLLNPKIVRQAENKMAKNGRHPLWPDEANANSFSEGETWN